MSDLHRKLALKIILLITVFAAGFATHVALAQESSVASNAAANTALRETGKYALVSPLLLCADTKNFAEDTALQAKIQSAISEAEDSGDATDVSVYVRDGKGRWSGVNENDTYDPASLLKVPIMIAYYKEAETDPALLSKTLVYDGSYDYNAGETFKSENDIQPGTYTIDNLIKAMIVNSDNNAESLLFNNIDQNSLSEVFTDLGLTVPPNSNGANPNYISAKSFSYFFRVLYNATYLDADYSEKAMELFTGPDFPQGIRSTIPSNILVAQKFGERTILSPQGAVVDRELHDCGFVFIPGDTYLVCIMTRGNDFQKLLSVIDSISTIIYNEEQSR